MKTILYIPSESRTVEYPNGYHVGGALKPLGEIEPGVWHLEYTILEQPEYDPATQYISQIPGAPNEDNTKWLVGWTINEIPPPTPPIAITPRQLQLALLSRGITPETIETMLTGNAAALIEWRKASEIRRDHPLVLSMAGALNMTEQDLANMFLEASTI